jgi:hypothetical protein
MNYAPQALFDFSLREGENDAEYGETCKLTFVRVFCVFSYAHARVLYTLALTHQPKYTHTHTLTLLSLSDMMVRNPDGAAAVTKDVDTVGFEEKRINPEHTRLYL